MTTFDDTDRRRARRDLEKKIAAKEAKKERARREGHLRVWFGLGMFGLVGWSVAIPALIGIAVGLWIDTRWPSRFSWTLMLLVFGVGFGCLNAWRWITREIQGEEQDSRRE